MGQIIFPKNSIVGIDANILIYHIERASPYVGITNFLWDALDNKKITIITSELTYLESLIKPVQKKDTQLIKLYKSCMLEVEGFSLIPISLEILDKAIYLRALYNLKTPDAIQAATAILNECGLYVTNDPIFKRIAELNVLVLDDLTNQK